MCWERVWQPSDITGSLCFHMMLCGGFPYMTLMTVTEGVVAMLHGVHNTMHVGNKQFV